MGRFIFDLYEAAALHSEWHAATTRFSSKLHKYRWSVVIHSVKTKLVLIRQKHAKWRKIGQKVFIPDGCAVLYSVKGQCTQGRKRHTLI